MAEIDSEKLKELKGELDKLGLTQKDMATHLGCSARTIRNIFNAGQYKLSQIEELIKLRDNTRKKLAAKATKLAEAI